MVVFNKMNTEEKIKKVINDGYIIADKITRAKSDEELNALSDEIDAYTNFVNTEFGKIDDFSNTAERYNDLVFYCRMAVKEKSDHIEYYTKRPNETSSGILDFLEFLDSREWLNGY